jgi:HD-GYP domain-containing protein (c-di-GMP phosphodiesterase class II)
VTNAIAGSRLMGQAKSEDPVQVSRGELLGALSLAIDLGLGMPMETMQRSAIVAQRLGRAAGLRTDEIDATYYLALVRFVGCTSSSHGDAMLFGDELGAAALMTADDNEIVSALRHTIGPGQPTPTRALMFGRAVTFALSGQLREQHRIHCEAAAVIAERLDMPTTVRRGIVQLYERWDGRGTPNGLSGEALTPAIRAVHVATLATILARSMPPDEVAAAVQSRGGRQLDPALAKVFAANVGDLLVGLDGDLTALLLAEEPQALCFAGLTLDRALEAVADFGDLKTPHMLGHSRRVARLAADAASRASLPPGDIALVRRAALVHDLGRVGVPEKLWVKKGPLTAAEHERIRLHTYLTERIFAASPMLAEIGRVGGSHHERLDGAGYHRGTLAGAQSAVMRLLAAANAYCALTEPRPHRPTFTGEEAARELTAEAKAGRLDPRSVDAVLAASGAPPLRRRAANIALSEREIEVLRLVARQMTTKEIARALDISPKTVERHITHIYDKIGVTTRAGAALYATDAGLM